MTMKLRVWVALVLITLPVAAMADVRPAALFADGMVIQRETNAPVWGTADAGEQVTVTASWGGTAAVTAGEKGNWMVKLQTPAAGGPHTLTIKGNNTVEIKDVLSGEVWFCSGQSNMDFEMKKLSVAFPQRTTPEHEPAANYVKKEIETAKDDLLRQFSGPLYKSHKIEGDTVTITFHSDGSGLMVGSKIVTADTQESDQPLSHFQICGADRQWRWAQAEITGKDTIAVSHADVPNPTVVRYAWAPNPESANLYNKEGLPASIFTTEAEIPVKADAVTADASTKIRVVAYNVACGQWATPEQIAEVLKPLNPDIVLLSEVPKANRGKDVKDWSHRVAEKLDLKHVHVGTVSSANHKAPAWGDMTGQYGGKFKSVLSRTPLSGGKDFLPEGSGWRRASAVRVETEIGGRKFAIYSLHLPGFAHHKAPRLPSDAWEGSKHRSLATIINAEDASYDVIVGGDFNEWTDSVVMGGLLKTCKLENAITSHSIDHILYSTARPIELLEAKRDWGPKNQNDKNQKAEGCLSDHPWVYCELEIRAGTGSASPQK